MLTKTTLSLFLLSVIFCFSGCVNRESDSVTPPPKEKETQQPLLVTDASIKEIFLVKLETSKGDIVIEVHPEWAPIGATRFHKLVEAKYYDGCRFFRVVDNFVVQTGINGDPKVSAIWRDKPLKTEEVKRSNTTGFVTYAQLGDPNTRTTQFFINYSDDNKQLDAMQFPPFGKVVEGMDVAKSFYSGYDPKSISQESISFEGNSYLKLNFPKLDFIKTARIVTSEMIK